MTKYEITTRYSDALKNRNEKIATLKKQERARMLKQYPTAKRINQIVITDGIPDKMSNGDLRSNGQIAIRTEFELDDAQ